MINVVCTIANKDQDETNEIKDVTVTSVSHGYQMVRVVIGDKMAEVDGKELIAAIENSMNTH